MESSEGIGIRDEDRQIFKVHDTEAIKFPSYGAKMDNEH